MEAYLTIQETAGLLKVSERTVRRWIEKGELAALKIGRAVRIRQQDIDSRVQGASVEVAYDTEEQLAVLERASALRAKIRARNGGKPASSAVELLREIRLERAGGQ